MVLIQKELVLNKYKMFSNEAQNPGDSVINWVNDIIPNIVNNANNLFNYAIAFVILLIAIYWIYTGYTIFKDAKKRFAFNSSWMPYLILAVGIITGPIGKIVYNLVRPSRSQYELDFIAVEHKFYYNQASKVADCISCGAYVLEGHTYCTNCGTQNRFKCSKCGALTDYDDLYCYNCGLDFAKRREEIFSKIEKNKIKEIQKESKSLASSQNSKKGASSEKTKKEIASLQKIQDKARETINIITGKSKSLLIQAKEKANTFRKK